MTAQLWRQGLGFCDRCFGAAHMRPCGALISVWGFCKVGSTSRQSVLASGARAIHGFSRGGWLLFILRRGGVITQT